MTVKSTTVIVELRAAGVLSRCEVPLAYIGPFSSLSMGYQIPCKLKVGSWECCTSKFGDCLGDRPGEDCLRVAPGGGVNTLDNIAVHGGQGSAAEGACCFPDTSCEVRYQGDCTLLGGQPGPAGSTCETHACCPPFLPDHDMDGDVDLADFGWFQTCLAGPEMPAPTVPCRCADFQNDGHVDDLDLLLALDVLEDLRSSVQIGVEQHLPGREHGRHGQQAFLVQAGHGNQLGLPEERGEAGGDPREVVRGVRVKQGVLGVH